MENSKLQALPYDVWRCILHEWIDSPHDLARLDMAVCNRQFRYTIHSALKSCMISMKIVAPRNFSKLKRFIIWLISRKVKIQALLNLEISYLPNLLEYFEEYSDIGQHISTLSLSKTVAGTRDNTGVNLLPRFLSLLPNLIDFQSILGKYYSPINEIGPHYLSFLRASNITHLSEEIANVTDLNRIQSMQWPNLTHLSLQHAFAHDNVIFQLLVSSSFVKLVSLEVGKLDEFQELDELPLDLSQWNAFPSLPHLKQLKLTHWNQQAHSNNASARILSTFLVHRALNLQHVFLEGLYVADSALQLLLFDRSRANNLSTLSLRNTCETLDQTCLLLQQHLIEDNEELANIFPMLHTLVLEQVPHCVIQQLLPLTKTAKSLHLQARETIRPSYSFHHRGRLNEAAASDNKHNVLDFDCVRTNRSNIMWEELFLDNVSMSVTDAHWLFHEVVESGLKTLVWKHFTGISAEEMIAALSKNDSNDHAGGSFKIDGNNNIMSSRNNSSGLCILTLKPASKYVLPSLDATTPAVTPLNTTFCQWLRDSKTLGTLRQLQVSHIPFEDRDVLLLLTQCPRLTSLSLTHIHSETCTLQETNLQLQLQIRCNAKMNLSHDRSTTCQAFAPLRSLRLGHLPNLHWSSLCQLVKVMLPSVLKVQIDHCNHRRIHSQDSVESALTLLWQLAEGVVSRPCKIYVDGEKVTPVK